MTTFFFLIKSPVICIYMYLSSKILKAISASQYLCDLDKNKHSSFWGWDKRCKLSMTPLNGTVQKWCSKSFPLLISLETSTKAMQKNKSWAAFGLVFDVQVRMPLSYTYVLGFNSRVLASNPSILLTWISRGRGKNSGSWVPGTFMWVKQDVFLSPGFGPRQTQTFGEWTLRCELLLSASQVNKI